MKLPDPDKWGRIAFCVAAIAAAVWLVWRRK